MTQLLLALLVALTGLERTVDPELTAIAQERVVEISACDSCFTHDGQHDGTWEVLAWNVGTADPVTRFTEQWRDSPMHWAILTNADLTRIGCAVHQVVDRTYAACVLLPGAMPSPPAPASTSDEVADVETETEAPLLPNTATAAP